MNKIEPIQMQFADITGRCEITKADLVLFLWPSGFIDPSKRADQLYLASAIGSIIKDYPVGTNRVFVVVDKCAPDKAIEDMSSGFEACNVTDVYIAGINGNDETSWVCSKMSDYLSARHCEAVSLDSSVLDSLFYVQPFSIEPVLIWLKYSLLAMFKDEGGVVYSDCIEDDLLVFYNGEPSIFRGVRGLQTPKMDESGYIQIDLSYYVDIICGKDPNSSDSYPKKYFALSLIDYIQRLSQEDVNDLIYYLQSSDSAMSPEHVAALKERIRALLGKQDKSNKTSTEEPVKTTEKIRTNYPEMEVDI